jgi:hypothetical protein
MCCRQAGWRAWAALIRGKTIIGLVAMFSHSTVSAWLSAIPRASLATEFAVSGAATIDIDLGVGAAPAGLARSGTDG